MFQNMQLGELAKMFPHKETIFDDQNNKAKELYLLNEHKLLVTHKSPTILRNLTVNNKINAY